MNQTKNIFLPVVGTFVSGRRILQHSTSDALLVLLAVAHGCALVWAPSALLIAVGVWWNSNTIAHNFLHLPFFRTRLINRVFAAYLTLLLGIPQRLWRDRHLAHHAERKWRVRLSGQLLGESALVGLLWAGLLWQARDFFLTTYLPGWLAGLALCQLQGHYEHARGTTSHYGWIYNFLFFNDGYHVEHHARPKAHWKDLPLRKQSSIPGSRWPAVLRWLEIVSLESLEKLVLQAPALQQWMLRCHERAFRRLLPHLEGVHRITIVGGGIFPRTALILGRLLPGAHLTIVDCRADHLQLARRYLPPGVKLVQAWCQEAPPEGADLLIVPLSFKGNREPFYRLPVGGCACVVHDWIWRARGRSTVVSWLLLKRLNLVSHESACTCRSIASGADLRAGRA